MNKMSAVWLTMTLSTAAMAGISYQKTKNEPAVDAGKLKTAVEVVAKPRIENDLSGVNTRLRIEGAKFRSFNLLFVPTVLGQKVENGQKMMAAEIRQIIERDLTIVGGINFVPSSNLVNQNDHVLLKQKGVEGKSSLSLDFSGASVKAVITHNNFVTGRQKTAKFLGNVKDLRKLSHHISQNIFEEFIGPESLFMLQIAAVKRDAKETQIVLMDFDGQNEQAISSGPAIKASPYFSPSGKSILYTEITTNGQRIVEQTIGTKILSERIKKSGLNLDARVLPDDSGMLATLSFQGQASIYHARRDGSGISLLTDSLGLNLSPTISISGDGKEIVVAFVSTRSGSPQIFEQVLAVGKKMPAKRLTFKGNYNQTPQFSPDGSLIAFTGRDENKVFDVFLLERASERITRVTENQGRNQEPYFTPSGRHVIFTSERDGVQKPGIFLSTLNGDHQVRLTSAGSYYSPVVRPK